MTESGSPLPQDAVARFAADAKELRQRTEAARAALESATATQTDGAVTVTVDVSGALVGLRLAPSAMERGPDALARAVLRTARSGRVQALRQAQRDVAAIVGPDSRAVAILRRQEHDLEPPSEPEPDGSAGLGW
ncbi:MAG TPA: YbaB/EbfC family nucleoid-associated protein [Jatrophihabitans sp.]|jgi:DNA-binding protein YbaB